VIAFRWLALRTDRLRDVPNERSLHETPVVRGAGLAIVVGVLAVYTTYFGIEANFVFVCTAGLVAVVGFLDDLYSLPVLPRLLCHVFAACALVYSSGPLDEFRNALNTFVPGLGSLGPFALIFFIVWITNAFNFMDGIDGIAGMQGMTAGLGWMVYGLVTGEPRVALLGSIILGSCAAFLILNWQPAIVFMGDTGSTFLGFTLASVPLIDVDHTGISLLDSALMSISFIWLFLFDTTYTRSIQLITGKPFWKPHSEHLYQQLVVLGSSHQKVTLFFGLCGVLISCFSALGYKIGFAFSLSLIVVFPILLLFWVRKKRLT